MLPRTLHSPLPPLLPQRSEDPEPSDHLEEGPREKDAVLETLAPGAGVVCRRCVQRRRVAEDVRVEGDAEEEEEPDRGCLVFFGRLVSVCGWHWKGRKGERREREKDRPCDPQWYCEISSGSESETRSLMPTTNSTAERKASGGDWCSKERE